MPKIAHCIYCGNNDPRSREHSVPRCLGPFQGQTTLKNRICKRCNTLTGKLDEQFCRVGRTGLLRFAAGIGKTKNLYRRSHGLPPIALKSQVQGYRTDVLVDFTPGKPSIVSPLRQIVLRCKEGLVNIPIGEQIVSPEDFDALLKREGITSFDVVDLICCLGEEAWIESLVRKYIGNKKLEWHNAEQPPQELTLTASTTTSDDYYREISKIAFHHALEVVHFIRGDEPEFTGIREFIMGRRDDFSQFVQERGQFDLFFAMGNRPWKWQHQLLVNSDRWQINVLCQFFAGPAYLSPCYVVQLGSNPLRTIVTPIQQCHAFVYLGDDAPKGYKGVVTQGIAQRVM